MCWKWLLACLSQFHGWHCVHMLHNGYHPLVFVLLETKKPPFPMIVQMCTISNTMRTNGRWLHIHPSTFGELLWCPLTVNTLSVMAHNWGNLRPWTSFLSRRSHVRLGNVECLCRYNGGRRRRQCRCNGEFRRERMVGAGAMVSLRKVQMEREKSKWREKITFLVWGGLEWVLEREKGLFENFEFFFFFGSFLCTFWPI